MEMMIFSERKCWSEPSRPKALHPACRGRTPWRGLGPTPEHQACRLCGDTPGFEALTTADRDAHRNCITATPTIDAKVDGSVFHCLCIHDAQLGVQIASPDSEARGLFVELG